MDDFAPSIDRLDAAAPAPYMPRAIPEPSRDAAKAFLVNMSISVMSTSNKASFVTAVVMVFILSREVALPALSAWLAVVFGWTVARALFIRRYVGRRRSDQELIAAELPFAFVMGGMAVTWGALIAVTGFSRSTLVLTSIVIALCGYISNGASALASTPRVWAVSVTCCIGPLMGVLITSSDPVHRLVALGLFFHMLASVGILKNNYEAALGSVALRFENQDLIAILEEEHLKEAAARQRAERVSQDKSRFLAAASHDVRQPLSALGLFVDALRERSLDAGTQQIVGSIGLAHGSLAALHEELMDISRIDSGAVVSKSRKVRWAAIAERLEAEAAPRAAARGLGFKVVSRDLDLFVDEELLLRILRNLVSNAIAFTPAGRILVSIRKRTDGALIQVWDTGIGIAEAERELIFEELYQVDGAERSREKGLGLGLSIVRRLARMLDSEVSVRSVVGKGSCFQLSVPLAR